MGITVFNRDTVLEFVPEYGGNREDESPCVIGLRYVPFSKVQEYAELYTERVTDLNLDINPSPGDACLRSDITKHIQRKQFLDNVVSISGIFDGSREITDVAEFYDIAPQPLIFEIMRVMENPVKIKAGLLKKPAGKTSTTKEKKDKG